jgi:hypothetical protein
MPILRERQALGSHTEVAAVEGLRLRNAHFISHRSHRKLAETQRPIYRRDPAGLILWASTARAQMDRVIFKRRQTGHPQLCQQTQLPLALPTQFNAGAPFYSIEISNISRC